MSLISLSSRSSLPEISLKTCMEGFIDQGKNMIKNQSIQALSSYSFHPNHKFSACSLKSRNKGRNIGSSYVDYSDFSLPEISLKTCMEGFIDDNSDKIRDEVQKAFSTKHKGTWEDEQEVRLFGLEKGSILL